MDLFTAAPPRPPAPKQDPFFEDEIFKVDFGKIFSEPLRSLTPQNKYNGIKLPEKGRVNTNYTAKIFV